MEPISLNLPRPGIDSPLTGALKTNTNLSICADAVNRIIDSLVKSQGGNLPPTASFTTSLSGLTVTVDGSASADPEGGTIQYGWDFGDGDTATGVTASHTYAAGSTYYITLTVTDPLGAAGMQTQKLAVGVTVNQPPTAAFTVSTSGLTVTVNGSASSDPDGTIASWRWDFGVSGATAAGATSSYTYPAAGTYTVTLTVTDNDGATDTVAHQVSVATTTTALGDTGGTSTTPTGTGITSYASLSGSDFSTRVNSAGTGQLVALPAGTYTFDDFAIAGSGSSPTQFRFGAKLTNRGLVGGGSKFVNVQMTANSSNWASDVPAQGTKLSNQLQYIYINSSSPKFDGIRIVGTSQGHYYNGLRFDACANPTLTNSTITGIPGNAGSPPGETFSVNFQGSTGTVTVTNVTVDGQNVAAVAIGSNNSAATYQITNLLAKNCKASAGWASWEHRGVMNFYGFVVQNSARAFNAERLAGVVNFYDPVWDDPFSGHSDVNPTYESGWTGGTLNFYFTNQTAWNNFIAGRTNKKITAVSNSSSVSFGLVKGSVIKVYIGNQLQPQSNYVTWTGI